MANLYSSRFHPKLQGCNILSLRFVTMLCMLFITPKFVESRGRMMEPVQRSSLWRRGFDALVNSDDDALNCGGKWRQQHDNKGKCGVCGDPYDIILRDHEAGGKYASGIISNRYTTNDTSILVVIDITNFLGGFFEFRICPHNSFKTPVKQACLDRHQLKIEGNMYRYYPSRRGPHHLRVELPKGMSCIQCVLQWKWHTGKDWGICPDGIGRIGCGPQEEYVNCADIAIDPATPQDLDIGLSTGFFDFPLNSVRQENILNPNSDVNIPAVKPPPGGIPLSMENMRNDVMVEPASFVNSGTFDTGANMIEPKKPFSVFSGRSGDRGTAIQPKFEFFNGEHSTSIVSAMTDTTNASTNPANTGAHKDDIVVLPFMGDIVNKESITNSGSNGSRVSEIYTEVNKMKDGTKAEATTMPYVKGVLMDMAISNISNLGPSLYSQTTDTRTGIDVTFSQKNDKGTSTMVIQSTTDDVHTTSQLYDITTPGAVSNTFDRNIPTAAESILLDSDNTSLARVGMDVSISTGMPPASNASDARNETGTLGSLASRQTRSILRIPDLSIEATTISLNQSFNLEGTVQSQENIESSTVISSNLQSETVSQNQAGNFSIMPGRLFGVPLVRDSGSQLSTKMNDLSKSIQTDAGASQEVNISSLGASVQNQYTISGLLKGTSYFDKGTQTDLTSANGWFRNVDVTSAQDGQMTSSGQISQISSITAEILNQPQTEPNETATGYESWVQPTTIFPTITSSEASTWNEQSNQSQSIRSRIMSMMGQSSSGSGSVNESTSSATSGGVTSERPITSSQVQLSQIQLQPIFDNLLQALQAKNFSLANTSHTSQRDTNIYEYLQALQALLLEKILNHDIARFQNWDTQGIHSSTVMSPGIGPDAWVQPNVEGSQRATLETTTERAPVLTENAPVSNPIAAFESAKENRNRAQNKIQEQTSNETSSNMVETNAVELQQQSNNIQQSEIVKRGNMKQGIIDSTIFQAENAITNDKDARQRQSQAQYINANALQSNEVTSLADSHTTQQTLRNRKEHNPIETVNASAIFQQDTQIVLGTGSISAHESQMQKNKTVQMNNATSIDLQYSMQPVNRGDFRKVSQGQITAISDQQTSHTQPGNTISVVSSKPNLQENVAVQTQKEVKVTVDKTETKLSNVTQDKTHENQPVTISNTALDQKSASWSDQSDYIVSTEAYPSDTFKPEPSGADTWFLPDPVPLTTVPPPRLPKAQSTHWEQNTPTIINRENQGSQRRIYPRPDRLATMYLRNIFTQLSPETNPLTIVVGLTPDMLMRAGVNPRIAESGNIGEIITALESVLGVSLRSRRSGSAVGPEGLDLGGAGSAPFDSLSILGGGGGAGSMSGNGPNDPVMGRDQQLMDGVGADMRGNGKFMNPVQRRRQQLRTEVMRRRQFMQEMRMLQDVMQLLGLGPEPLEPGDPGYRPPRGQGLGAQANPTAGLEPADVAPGAGGLGGALGGGMGMGRSRSQISQLNALMEMIGL
ncbi:hypothetical protein CHS0354_009485 [Potamilus streckersoni]|uniref:Chitin-binding type-4 domain-containing protein n=1 Tax=Potamilus streckersoni TaxID=2493646 RepID=A0AAE0VK31_9BIVA|nr:hypothetical protein CHS0354_009485 [Potamilus streckersoni]